METMAGVLGATRGSDQLPTKTTIWSIIRCRRVEVIREDLLHLGSRPDDLTLGIQKAEDRRPAIGETGP
jgi:hypothetical protein